MRATLHLLAVLAVASPAFADPPDAGPDAGASQAGAVLADPSKCAKVTPEWFRGVKAQFDAISASTHAGEGTNLADARGAPSMARDLAAVYELCMPRVPWESTGAYTAFIGSIQRHSPGGVMTDAQRASIDRARATYQDAQQRELDARVAPILAWAKAEDVAIDQETACRASTACVAARAKAHLDAAVAPVCAALRQRADDVATIARENSNPSGVRDLRVMHDAGEDIQAIDAQMPALKAAYASVAKKAFSTAACDRK